jgi:hypothetical protein
MINESGEDGGIRIGRGKQVQVEYLPQYHLVHHKSHTVSTGVEPRTLRWKSGLKFATHLETQNQSLSSYIHMYKTSYIPLTSFEGNVLLRDNWRTSSIAARIRKRQRRMLGKAGWKYSSYLLPYSENQSHLRETYINRFRSARFVVA